MFNIRILFAARKSAILLFAVFALQGCNASSSEPVDLLIRGGAVVTMDGDSRILENGYVAVRGDRIIDMGDAAQLQTKNYRAKETIDAHGKAILPGLINTHTHAPMVLFRGISDDLDLQEWLTKYIFPAEARNVTREFVVAGTRLALAEMILGGTTTYVDMYYFEDAIAEETKQAGMRAVLGETVLDFPVPDNKTWGDAMTYTEAFLLRWKNDPLITPAVAPHAPYTVNADHLKQAQALAERHDVPVVIHIAEAPTETEYMSKTYNDRSVPYLDKLGFLTGRVISAHTVHVNEEEIRTLAARAVGVAHCPQSNMKLASGVAPLRAMLQAGVAVGLGTDGAASNNDLNMWEEIDTAAKLHKLINNDPTFLSAREALELATIGGARVINREKDLGTLEVGKLADIIVVDLDAVHLTPRYNLFSHLVYAAKATDVSDTIVNGKILMRGRKLATLDEGAIRAAARQFQERVSQSLKNGN
ncbi:MAG: amidohydrolase [Acidobacteria bacterium]|nr:amidohydrolase [Acidobacteriota bacterium]